MTRHCKCITDVYEVDQRCVNSVFVKYHLVALDSSLHHMEDCPDTHDCDDDGYG
jgi:hypothetical protein